jgi:hypothetical protein
VVEVGPDLKRLRDYVAGRLSEEDRQTLEARLAQDPALVQELEQLMRFREGLQLLASQAEPVRREPRVSRLRRWAPFLAAAAVAGIALLLWTNHLSAPDAILTASVAKDTTGAFVPVAAHFTFVTTRGVSVPDLYRPAGGLIELRAYPATVAHRYRVTLSRADDDPPSTVGTVTELAVAPDGYVHSYADASRLSSGSYALRLEPMDGSASETFSFNLRSL